VQTRCHYQTSQRRVRGKHRGTGQVSPRASYLQRHCFRVIVPPIIRGMDTELVTKTADMSQHPTIEETNISTKYAVNISF